MIFETGPVRQSGKQLLTPPAAYTGGRPSAVERRAEPVFIVPNKSDPPFSLSDHIVNELGNAGCIVHIELVSRE